MSEKQLGLFDANEVIANEEVKFLNVIKDEHSVVMTKEDLFDSKIYHTLYAITFVSSPKFFYESVKGFKHVELILGIEDGNLAESFRDTLYKMIHIEGRYDFLKELPEEARKKIVENKFNIRFPRKNYPIHSKIYLLEGEGNTRLIIGSANLTETAFGDFKQFEEVVVYDNHKLYDLYKSRYDEIYKQTADYIPDKIKQDKHLITDPDTLIDILQNEIMNKTIEVSVTEDEMEQIKDFETNKHKVEKEEEIIEESLNVITKLNKKTKSWIYVNILDTNKLSFY